jgi:hypothetical protein
MTNPTVTIHNVETGEIIERPMTAAEKAALEADAKAYADKETAKAETEAVKEAAQAKLAALGLTADDLKALGL